MNIETFQQKVTRTFPDLGRKLLNSIHCTLGIGSELMEEVTMAQQTGDKVNLGEELADAQWYLANYATLHKIALPGNAHVFYHAGIPKKTISDNLKIAIGRLQDFDKKELCYKKVVNEEIRRQTVLNLNSAIEFTAIKHDINMAEYRQKVIDKLLDRYPLATGFTEESAINRNVVAERLILEKSVLVAEGIMVQLTGEYSHTNLKRTPDPETQGQVCSMEEGCESCGA